MLPSVEKGTTVGESVLLLRLVTQAVKDKSGNNGAICIKQGAEAAPNSGA